MDFNFNFHMPANIISGNNVVLDNGALFKSLGNSCIIVTGKSSARLCGALEDVCKILDEQDIIYMIYDKITENPLTIDCYNGGNLARDFNADFVIGIGGGSPLDAAKAICVYATNDHIVDDDIYTASVINKPLPLVAIGTTAGTGSEVSGVSVLTRKNGRKQSVSGKNYYAQYVLADPKYTYSLSYSYTVSTALDALAHAVESMFSPRADFLSIQFSLMASKIIYPYLKEMSQTNKVPNQEGRNALYYASLYSGFALNKGGTGFPHGMGYALTEDYNVPHGYACAVFLPAYLEEAEKANPRLHKDLFDAMNTTPQEFEALFSHFCKFDFKIPEQTIFEYEKRWENLKNFKNSPTDFNNNDAGNLVRKLFK